MEDQNTTDFFVSISKDEEKDIISMLLSGLSHEEIIGKFLDKRKDNSND